MSVQIGAGDHLSKSGKIFVQIGGHRVCQFGNRALRSTTFFLSGRLYKWLYFLVKKYTHVDALLASFFIQYDFARSFLWRRSWTLLVKNSAGINFGK
jgi:hypothetical protein